MVVVQGVKGLEMKCRSASEPAPLPKYLQGLLQYACLRKKILLEMNLAGMV